jgi:HPt (histidine-containing phosphotransfer) domain-containing protein
MNFLVMNIRSTQINEMAALAALDGNRELLGELAQIFVEDTPGLLEELRAAMDAGNAAKCCRLVHSLKGLSSTFFASPTIEFAGDIEKELIKDSLERLTDGGMEQLSRSIDDLTGELKSLGYIK